MIRATTIILAFLSIAVGSFSQGVELEFNIRPARTTVHDLPERFDPTWYCTSSVGATYRFKNNSMISLGLLYDKKGTHDKITGFADVPDDYWERDEYNFKYLTIPVQFAHRFGNKVKFQLGVGFYSSFLLNFEYVTTTSEGDTRKSAGSDALKKTDFGLSTSLSIFVFERNNISMKLGLDNYYGLTDVNNKLSGTDRSIKHNSMGVSMGFVYKVK
jgi:hypothetical protein